MGWAASTGEIPPPLYEKRPAPAWLLPGPVSTGHPPAAEKPAHPGPATPPPALKFKGGQSPAGRASQGPAEPVPKTTPLEEGEGSSEVGWIPCHPVPGSSPLS